MKKRELEEARASLRAVSNHPRHGNPQGAALTDTEALRSRVSKDLNIIKDAYDVGATALVELQKTFASAAMDAASPSDAARTLAFLSKAFADISKSLIALRGEGRATIREAMGARDSGQPGGPANADPPQPARLVGGAVYTPPDKISASRAIPEVSSADRVTLTGVPSEASIVPATARKTFAPYSGPSQGPTSLGEYLNASVGANAPRPPGVDYDAARERSEVEGISEPGERPAGPFGLPDPAEDGPGDRGGGYSDGP